MGLGSVSDIYFWGMTISGVIISISLSGMTNYFSAKFTHFSHDLNHAKNFFFSALVLFFVIFSFFSFLVLSTSYFWGKGVFGFDWISLNNILILSATLFFLISSAINSIISSWTYFRNHWLEYELICFFALLVCYLFIEGLDLPSGVLVFIYVARFWIQQLLYVIFFERGWRSVNINYKYFKIIYKDVRAMVSFSAYYKSEPFFDRLVISSSAGAITTLHLLLQVYNALLALWYKISTAIFVTKLSSMINNNESIKGLLIKAFIVDIVVILFGALMLFSDVFIHFNFNFYPYNFVVEHISIVKSLFGFAVACFLGQTVSSIYYAFHDFKTPALVSSVMFTILLPIKIYMFNRYGLFGLALTVSAYHILNTTLLAVYIFYRFQNDQCWRAYIR